jgi:hypothetical protein
MITAALLAGCTGDSPDERPTTAAAGSTAQMPPSLEPSPSQEPSKGPSLSPADEAADEVEAVYRQWIEFQNQTLQDPPPVSGDDAAAQEAFAAFETEIRHLARDEAEGLLISTVDQYNDFGWRQEGRNEVTWIAVDEVTLSGDTDASRALLRACLTPQELRVVDEEGTNVFPDLDVMPLVAEAVLDNPNSPAEEGWRVSSNRTVEGQEC